MRLYYQIDEAEENILSEPEKALEAFEKLLSDHPTSARIRFDLPRSREAFNVTAWSEDDKEKHHQKVLDE